ncbi:MAG TPA: MarR family transcriptional regulator [Anaerolineales bacterium]
MDSTLDQAREHFIQGMSRISSFWGYPRAMGAIYGALYLSPQALSLDELAEQANISKGAVSTNVRNLERLGMVQKEIRLGERRDFYVAETDFWQVVKSVLRERQRSEFDHAIRTVSESLEMTKSAQGDQPLDVEKAAFYQARMREMERFFNTLDNLVVTALALDELRAGSLERLLGGWREKGT